MKILILHDAEKMGAFNQCFGLAEALGCGAPEVFPIALRFPWRFLPQRFWPRCFSTFLKKSSAQQILKKLHAQSSLRSLDPESKGVLPAKNMDPSEVPGEAGLLAAPETPDLILVSGRKSLLPGIMLKEIYPQAKLLMLQKPGAFYAQADGIILPEHDGVAPDQKTFLLCGNTHRVTPARLFQEKEAFPDLCHQVLGHHVITLLIGGPNGAFRFSTNSILKQWERLLANLSQDPSLFYLVSLSRRTPPALAQKLRQQNHPRVYLWDGQGPNPYLAFLGLAEAFVITADSVAMTSEAAATGKPIHILPLPGKSPKFERYHQALQARGITRVYAGQLESWDYVPLEETQRVVRWIKEVLTPSA